MTDTKAEYFIAGSPFSAPPLAAGLYVVSTGRAAQPQAATA